MLGGSQAAKVFADSLPLIFRDCSNDGVPLKIYHHCLPYQNDELSLFYKNSKIEFEIWKYKMNKSIPKKTIKNKFKTPIYLVNI